MPENRQLVHAVEKALQENERTAKLEHVHVTAVSGVVFLDGEVETEADRDLVVKVVKGVKGVAMVRDRLQVNPQARGGGWKQEHHHGE